MTKPLKPHTNSASSEKKYKTVRPIFSNMLIKAWVSNLAQRAYGESAAHKNDHKEVWSLLCYLDSPNGNNWMKAAKIWRNSEYRKKVLDNFFNKHPKSKAHIELLIYNLNYGGTCSVKGSDDESNVLNNHEQLTAKKLEGLK